MNEISQTKTRHPSMIRLLQCAAEKEIHRVSDLAVELRESTGTIGNWSVRGVSRLGALKAQAKFGCSAAWILTGRGSSGQAITSRRMSHPRLHAPSSARTLSLVVKPWSYRTMRCPSGSFST